MSIQANQKLTHLNTFQVATTTQYFTQLDSIGLLKKITHDPIWKKNRKLILGGGSNVLFACDYFEGLIVKNNLLGIQKIKETEDHVWLKVGAGENWHQFVQKTISQGYSGIENLSYIPGTVGAAPIQNIGAYGVEIKDVIESVQFFDLEKLELASFKNKACSFKYRDSVFKNALKDQIIVCSVIFKLNKYESFKLDYGEIKKTLEAKGIEQLSTQIMSDVITEIRKSKLPNPSEHPNAGSFFKNPFINLSDLNQLQIDYPEMPNYPISDTQVKIPAGWLIEKTGWKGKKVGHVGTYPKQALVIVNHDAKSSGKEIANLAYSIQNDVQKKFGIELTPEVRMIT